MSVLNLFNAELKKHLGLGPLSYLIYSRYFIDKKLQASSLPTGRQATSCKLMSDKPSSKQPEASSLKRAAN